MESGNLIFLYSVVSLFLIYVKINEKKIFIVTLKLFFHLEG